MITGLLVSQQTYLIVAAMALILLVFFAFVLIFFSFFRYWLQAFLSGTPITLVQLIGMKFRKSPARQIVTCGIAAKQAGFPVPWVELERAALQGIDLEKVILAYVTAKKRGDNFSFEELVDAERESQLDRLLK